MATKLQVLLGQYNDSFSKQEILKLVEISYTKSYNERGSGRSKRSTEQAMCEKDGVNHLNEWWEGCSKQWPLTLPPLPAKTGGDNDDDNYGMYGNRCN